MMAATSFQIKINQCQFFLPAVELSVADQILLLSHKEPLIIHFEDYVLRAGAESPLIRWNDFKNMLERSFRTVSFRTFDTQQVIIPTSLYMCLENLQYRDIPPKELEDRLANTKSLIEVIHQVRTEENLPVEERNALATKIHELLDKKADPTVTDDNGWNILHVAAYFNFRYLVTWIGRSPDIDETQEKVLLAAVTRDSNITPASLAKQRDHHPIYEQLSRMNNKDVAEADASQTLSSCRL